MILTPKHNPNEPLTHKLIRWTFLLSLVSFLAFVLWAAISAHEAVAVKAPVVRPRPKTASLPASQPKAPVKPKSAQPKPPTKTIETHLILKNLIIDEMTAAGYRAPHFAVQVALCESGLNPASVGDHGTSFGLWQIHLPAHPDITKEQALDPVWSTRWAAQMFAKGYASRWTCARLLAST